MPSNIVVLKAKGLNTSPNELNREEGSLIEADNVIIRRDGVIEQARGFKLWGTALPTITDHAKQILSYRNRLLRHYSNKIQFDNQGTGNFLDFSGTYSETDDGLRIKSIEANGNLYFTTSDGIKKISAASADDFVQTSGYITQAGGIKALDFQTYNIYSPGNTSGFLTQDSSVLYRVVWGIKDNNKNLILGSPSQQQYVVNKLSTLLISDMMRFLTLLDNLSNISQTDASITSARINDKNYINTLKLTLGSSDVDLRANAIALAKKLDNDIFLGSQVSATPLTITDVVANTANGYTISTITVDTTLSGTTYTSVATITFSAGNMSAFSAGQKIRISDTGFTIPGTLLGVFKGIQTITAVDSVAKTIKFIVTPPQTNTTQVVITATSGVWSITIPSIALYTVSNNTVCRIKFNEDPTKYLSATKYITVSGLSISDLNGVKQISSISSSNKTIEFITTATGDITYSIAEIHYGEFTNITVPTEIASTEVTGTNAQLVSIQDYLLNIQTKLLSLPTSILDQGSSYANYASLPGIGVAKEGVIYITLDTGKHYTWSSTTNTYTEDVNKTLLTDYDTISYFDITNSSSVKLTITIPSEINDNYFLQIYRSPLMTATLTDKIEDLYPEDELKLVYEAYPTTAELASHSMTVIDNTPVGFEGAYLYTNASSGEGILQSNESPPYAHDINRFKNYTFYANTKRKQNFILSLMGVVKLKEDYLAGITPTLTIATKTGITNTYNFVMGKKQQSTVNIPTTATVNSLDGKYFTLKSSLASYYVWFAKSSTTVDPAPSGTGIKVSISTGDTAQTIANKLRDKLSTYLYDFSSVVQTTATISGVVNYVTTITDINYINVPSSIGSGTSGLVTAITVNGIGEGAKTVLLSDPDAENSSPSIAFDETARSLVRVINQNSSEIVSAYYTSSLASVPGQMYLETRNLNTEEFYILANNSNTGVSFNPNLSPDKTGISTAPEVLPGNRTVITSANHGLVDGDYIFMDCKTPDIHGVYQITWKDINSFYINKTTTVFGSGTASYSKLTDTDVSTDEIKPNRIYYSKFQQPEAVPMVNYFNVGAEEKQILRIFPLRDSLFVFKEEGLYRVSGEVTPFSVTLFDSSVNLLAPDSLCVVDNLIYAWTNQGIQVISESGTQTISRPIDNLILKLSSSNYINFKTATWGIGYGSDSSVTMWTVSDVNSKVAQIGFRYNTLTNSWTTLNKAPISGIIFDVDNKMYLGMSDVNYIEQERKTFTRLDYAGREISLNLTTQNYIKDTITNSLSLKFADVSSLSVGDAIVQDQKLTIYEFNMLLKKLDVDPGTHLKYYLDPYIATSGCSLRDSLTNLATRLDTDSGLISPSFLTSISAKNGNIISIGAGKTPLIETDIPHGLTSGRVVTISGSTCQPSIDGTYTITYVDSTKFKVTSNVVVPGTSTGSTTTFNSVIDNADDIAACFNLIVTGLNANTGIIFNNYKPTSSITTQEAIITNIDLTKKQITLNKVLDYTAGEIIAFKALPTSFTYSPNTLGDPLNHKQIRQATVMMDTRTITNMRLEFKTDLKPAFIGVDFALDGNGIYGNTEFGEGFFGGLANSAPVRTLIPRDCQRCRYLIVRFIHSIAREAYQINGMTLTGNTGLSERAYR